MEELIIIESYLCRFHILSDFDEGKRSCRRKLERHNNRRRRKPNDSKEGVEKESQLVILTDDLSGDDDTGKGITFILTVCCNSHPTYHSLFSSLRYMILFSTFTWSACKVS